MHENKVKNDQKSKFRHKNKNKNKNKKGAEYLDAFCTEIKAAGAPRFAVVDWNHKLCFVAWSPDTAKGKDKMQYATIREGFVSQLEGIQLKIQATDDGELNPEVITKTTESKV